MSSPLALTKYSFLKKRLIRFHQATSHSNRITILSKLIAANISSLGITDHELSILDIGCGDMTMIHNIQRLLSANRITGMDIYAMPPHLKQEPYWQYYQSFDGHTIPSADQSFSVALLIDVLHHLPEKDQLNLLKEATRVASYVVIKDHLEYGFFSRQMLRLMDFVGNWAYGVKVPQRYFSISGFNAFIDEAGMQEIGRQQSVELYNHNWFLKKLLNARWQFIYVGKSLAAPCNQY